MLSHTSLAINGTLLVHQPVISETTRAFQRGTVIVTATEISFAKLPAFPLPSGFVPRNGMTIQLQLAESDGKPRKQVRTITLVESPKVPGTYRAAGQAKSERAFSAEDGWGHANYKFRAYFTHQGITTDGGIPAWLQASINRQNQYWNRLAYLCRQARRACSDVPVDEVKAFVNETILPAIDALNNLLGKSKLKIKHPSKLKVETPSISGVWSSSENFGPGWRSKCRFRMDCSIRC